MVLSQLWDHVVLDFLINRPQSVKIHGISSSTSHSTSAPHRDVSWAPCCTCSSHMIALKGTRAIKVKSDPTPPLHRGAAVEMVSTFKYLSLHISNDLTWDTNKASIIKKAHERLYFPWRVKRADLSPAVLTSFYLCVVESILTSFITVWYGNCSVADRKALQRVVKYAQRVTSSSLPSLEGIYVIRCRSRVSCILKDHIRPAHKLFTLLSSGRKLYSLKTWTMRLKGSF